MASKDQEEPFNTETDEETIAVRKKRLRRVSFADREITSVHIFNRDEDYEQESAAEPSSADEDNEVLGFFKDLAADSDDSREMSPEEGDDEEIASTKSFLRPIESPSPGSSIIGSATSNDEDNFFGPVSARFIRPGRLSNSAASDDNHDITMDSTAFSMHYRSLVMSELGDIKTPAGSCFAFEEKTPSQVGTPSDSGSFMVLTKAKKPISPTSLPVGKVSISRDSNDMSLVGENPHRYDYGRLSPTLEALLAEGSEVIHAVPIVDAKSLERNEVSIFNENGSGMMGMRGNGNIDMCNVGPDNISQEGISAVNLQFGEVNGGSTSTNRDQITCVSLSYVNDDPAADAFIDHQVQTPNQLDKVNKVVIKAVTGSNNVELPTISSGTPPDVNLKSNDCQLSLFSQPEPADLFSTQDSQKKSSSKAAQQNSHIDQPLDQQLESPLGGPMTMLSAKQKQILLDATNISRHSPCITPSPKQPGSLLRKENIKLGESVSSLLKSISKFKLIESSPHTSTLGNGLEKSEQKLLEYLSATSPSHIVVEETSRDLSRQLVDTPIVNLEKQFSVDRKNGEHKKAVNMCGDGNGTHKYFGNLNQNRETMIPGKDGEPLDHLSDNVSHEDKRTEMLAGIVMHQHLVPNDAMKVMSDITGSESFSLEITLDHKKDQKTTNDSNKNVFPPLKRLDQELSPAEQGSLFVDLKQQVQPQGNVVIRCGPDGNSMEYATTGSHLTQMADKLDSLFVDWRAQSSSPLREVNHMRNFTQVKREDDRKILPSALQNVSETVRNLQTPSRDTGLLKYQPLSPDKNCQIANDTIRTKEEPAREGIKASAHEHASPHVERSLNELSFLKLQDFENSSGRKRRSEEIVIGDADNDYKNIWMQRSPKVHKSRDNDLDLKPEHSNGSDNRNEKIGVDTILKLWTDISHKFSTETNQILSPLIDKLNIRAIDMFEDILVHLQKVNKYGALCSEILSQKSAQLLSSGIQKFHNLKLNYARHLSASGEREAVNDKLYYASSANFVGKHEVVANKVITRKQEAEAVDQKIKNLIKSFNTHCKTKGDLSCADTIPLLNDHLKKRALCRYIRQDLQLWEIDDLERTHGHNNLVLNYRGFICQRFTITAGPVSSMVVSNKVNNINIKKNFPNMDACTAFAFVFNAESTKKTVGSKSLTQETQKTSSLLCNLLAVVAELQLARIEIRNLTLTSFNSPSVEQLNLHLCFIDLNSGAKVTMILDMTCLNRGIYPSEILPYQLQFPSTKMQNSPPESLSAEINAATANLTNGYSRIIRLCRLVSEDEDECFFGHMLTVLLVVQVDFCSVPPVQDQSVPVVATSMDAS
ncbi:hypothetical protein Pint_01805 [Pistacia integerrima]|uniref:Uncharacterized protein n=1 Tax=Pistacia integerrima TaxID=434235 RepID=A0ACC0ZE11_9ROSI|nr:hypothetical protein Pint_01805 [Pistacia integerrima]